MNPNAMRMARKFGVSVGVAGALVAAGYAYPRKIRDASDEEIDAVVGESARADVRKHRYNKKAK